MKNPGDEPTGLSDQPRRKNFRLQQWKVDRAKEVLGAKTETEAVDRALDLVVFREDLIEGARSMRDAGLEDIFEDKR